MTDFLRRYSVEPLDGKYRLLERLGAGGMGEVYKAEHVLLGTIRVIKIIRAQISENADARERFLREARLATRVQHPNVATLYDFAALPDGLHYMVWEFIDGENVAQMLRRRGTLPPHEAMRLAIQALHGLDAIHRAGIVHRDISPENLMVTRDSGTVKIIDLGVAKGGDTDQTMTQAGIFIGKLRYASPEHLGMLQDHERIDGRADLYSLAITLYEMIAGRPPFEATSPHQYIVKYSREGGAAPPDLTPVPPPLRPVLARALAQDRKRRFATAADFANALDQIHVGDEAPTQITPLPTVIDRGPAPRRNRGLPIAIGAVIVLAILAILTVMRPWSSREPKTQIANMTTTSAPATPAQTTIAVTPPPAQTTTTTTMTTTAVPTTTTAAPPPQPQPRVAAGASPAESAPAQTVTGDGGRGRPPLHGEQPASAPAHAPTPTQQPQPPPPPVVAHVPTYFDGKGDSSHNDEAVAGARRALAGVTRVALQTSGDADLASRLADLLRRDGLTIADSADVTIRFNGTVVRQRFGRKERAGSATISRNGRVVFHYELPAEEYRVGDNPAEAFARVAGDLFR